MTCDHSMLLLMPSNLSPKRFFCKPQFSNLCDSGNDQNASMDRFADRVRARRKQLGLTQVQLARKCGLSQTTIADIERGRNDGSKSLLDIARALNCDPEHLTKGAPIGGLTNQQRIAADLIAGMSPDQAAAWLEVGRALTQPPKLDGAQCG